MDVCGQEVKESGIDAERERAFISAYLSKAETKSELNNYSTSVYI